MSPSLARRKPPTLRNFYFCSRQIQASYTLPTNDLSLSPHKASHHQNSDYSLEDVDSFSVGAMSTINLSLKDGETLKITGMFNKKLISALQEAGVKKA